MNIFKRDKKSDYKLALEEAKGCIISTRPGDPDSDFKTGDHGVRIMVSAFGDYQPFILTKASKDWLKKSYNMSDAETEKVFRTLMTRARQHVQEKTTEANAKKDDFIPGTRQRWTANPFRWGS
ncbi:MAG: hypothetical protein HWE10_09885 [Gammaproteobacteria bacterium]|nr:hypothetical protein [Gammaproteobacteria bacterium]